MGQSLVQSYIHIIFSTKNRLPLIKPTNEQRLHEYIAGICKKLECKVITIGGDNNHVHILLIQSRKIALMTLVQKIKANSSKWIKTTAENQEKFSWQNGYGAFSVDPNQIKVLSNYIKNQHEHHSKTTYKEEYRGFLKRYNIDYNANQFF